MGPGGAAPNRRCEPCEHHLASASEPGDRAGGPAPDRTSRSGDDRGQAVVELALVLPLVVLFVLGALQVAVVARDQLAIEYVAREAARAAAVSANPDGAAAAAAHRVANLAPIDVSASVSGDLVRVRVRYVNSHRRGTRRRGDRRRHPGGNRSDGLGAPVSETSPPRQGTIDALTRRSARRGVATSTFGATALSTETGTWNRRRSVAEASRQACAERRFSAAVLAFGIPSVPSRSMRLTPAS